MPVGGSLHAALRIARSMRDYLNLAWRITLARPRFALGYFIVVAVLGLTLLAPWMVPYSPITADPSRFLEPPSWDHLLGTDAVGMDIFSRTIYAPRVDLTIALLGTLISASVGSLVGALVG